MTTNAQGPADDKKPENAAPIDGEAKVVTGSDSEQAAKSTTEASNSDQTTSSKASESVAKDTTTSTSSANATTMHRQEPTEIEVEVIKKHGHKGIWFFTVINFFILIAIITAGYWYWMNYLQTDRVDPKVQSLESQYSQLQSNLSQIEVALSKAQDTLSTQNAELATLSQADKASESELSALAQQVQLNQLTGEGLSKRIADVAGRRPSDWLLAEADYLVKLAGKKLYLEEDVKSAIMLLKSADVRIADLADPSLLPVRALIAKDIQALQQVNDVASTSIALTISALIAQVNTLPLDTLKLPDPVAAEEKSTVSSDVSNWQANLKASWDAIVKDFVSVEKRSAQVQPFMSTKQQWLAREELKFALLNAQNAILQNENALFVQSLQMGLDTVVTHYDLENQGVEAYMQSIQDLINTDTKKVIPAQLDSQQPLAEVIDQRIQTLFAGGK